MPRHSYLLSCSLILCAALAAAPAHAQFFRSVTSRDGIDVLAVGDSGQVYRSLDGGATWSRTLLGNKPLRAVRASGFGIIVAGDSGKVFRSTDSGANWSLTVLSGAPDVRALAWPTPGTAIAVGADGGVYVSTDGGAVWNPQVSGTSERLNSVAFTDNQNGWIVGNNNVVLHTTNGGTVWAPVAIPSASRELRGVDAKGSTVWIVGEKALALKSDTDGASWTQLNLRLDAGSDVNAVWLQSPDSVIIAGGGGFLRRSTSGGATWKFPEHRMQQPISAIAFHNGRGWMVSAGTKLIPRTTDFASNWTNPTGTSTTRTWSNRLAPFGTARGATLVLQPQDKKTLYVIYGGDLYRSRNDGETWTQFATIPGATDANAFVISPKDSNLMVAAVNGPDRVARSTNGGANWTTTLTAAFGEYGIPLEMHPDTPDTLYFGPDSSPLRRSIDFGATWSTISSFNMTSPCDIVAMPDADSALILVGDGITGSGIGKIRRSTDGGVTWVTTFSPLSGGSEIPGMTTSRLSDGVAYATAWSEGSFKRSTDKGLTWPLVHTAGSTWGCDIAKDDPNFVIFGVYSGSTGYLSYDGGSTYTNTSLSGSNYSFYAKDRSLVLAQQGGGVYKLRVTDSYPFAGPQALDLTSTNGGPMWTAGSVHPITWNATNIALAKIEYRKTVGDPWQTVALVEGYAGSYDWTLPLDETSDARIRVSDVLDSTPRDSSDAPFTIARPHLAAAPDTLDLGSIALPGTASDTIHIANDGLVPLTVSSITSSNPRFVVSRDSLVIPPGGADTITVTYEPLTAASDTTEIALLSDAPDSLTSVTVIGSAYSVSGVGDRPMAFAAWQNQPNPFRGSTSIRYALPVRTRVELEVFDITGQRVAQLVNAEQGPGEFTVPFRGDALGDRAGRRGRLSSGVYFYRLRAGSFSATRKMVLMQ